MKTGAVLWKFQTGHQIASGPSVYSVNGTEYIAITGRHHNLFTGGTVASQLQVFALGANSAQSPSFTIAMAQRTGTPPLPFRLIGGAEGSRVRWRASQGRHGADRHSPPAVMG